MDQNLKVQDYREQLDNTRDSITAWGVAIFGSIKAYREWALKPSKEFGGSRPGSLLDTMERMQLLLLVLKQKYHLLNNTK